MAKKNPVLTLYLPAPERAALDAAIERENTRGAVPRLTAAGVIRRLIAEWVKKKGGR